MSSKAPKPSRLFRRLTPLLLLLACACLLTAQARAAGACAVANFGPPAASRVGNVRAVTAADFNGDGKTDVAAANVSNNNVSVLLGTGDGTFLAAASFAAGRRPSSIEAADMNGDGNLDLITANASSVEGSVTLMFGDGTGKFPTKKGITISSGSGTEATFATVGDFNADGKADVAVGVMTFNSVAVLLGDGAGNFPSIKLYNSGLTPSAGVARDFNGDGKLDLAVANRYASPSTVSILTGDGAGALSAPASFNVGAQPVSLVSGDFNGDGKADVATANYGSGNVSVLLGDGAGSLAAATNYGSGGPFPASLASADFNGDGHPDLAVGSPEIESVLILQGDGAGQFRPAANYTAGGFSLAAVLAKDLNGDAMPDLIVGNELSQSVTTLLNTCGAAPAAAAVQFDSATYSGFEQSDLAATVNVIRTGPLEGAAGVDYATSDATAGSADYAAASGTLSFADGEVAKSFNVTVKDDNIAEGAETVNLTLGNPSGAVLGSRAAAVLFIVDNDPTPTVSAADVSVTEGNGGTTDAVFNITLSNPSASAVSVAYETADASALAGEDYVGASGTLTFAPGETVKSLTVKVNGDTLDEITETFLLNLKSPTNATLADAQGVGTIRDDDASCPEPSFGPPANFAAGNTPWGMAAADFNRDGKLDLAVGNYNSNNISLMLGNGAGSFAAAVNFPTNVAPRSVAAGDFNGDGKLDLAATGSLFGTQVSVILGDGGGGFGAPTLYAVGSTPTAVAVGDFNGDGKDDIATSNISSANVSVLISNGAGFAAATNLAAGTSTTSVTVGDLNGDGRPDIVAANMNANNVSVFFNQGGGAFAAAVNLVAGQNPHRVAIADFDVDGAPDLAVVNSTSRDVTILRGDGAGGFTAAGSYPVGVRSEFVLAADFNGDGLPDLAVSHWTGHGEAVPAQASVLFGNGRGGFSTPWGFVPGSGSVELAAADFNADGKQDLVIANYSSQNVSLLLNACSFAASAAKVQLGSPAYAVSEGAGKLVFAVVRSGDISAPASVEYSTADGTASERGDYTGALGRLSFAAGERSKSVTLFVTDDAYVEGAESFTITLGNVAGASLGAPAASTVTINSDDVTSPTPNPIDGVAFFVRQHYRDFLGRDPDAPGLAFWTQEIEQCGADAACREVKRINVSAAFFLSIEFQQTGYLSYRARKAAFGDLPNKPVPVTREEMLRDMQVLGADVIVGAAGWEQKLEQNKGAYFDQLAASGRFTALYPQPLTPEQFVDALNSNAGGALSQAERDALVAELKANTKTRAQALRRVAEDEELTRAEFNKAFVLMQFFGYLRRDPDAAPDADFSGYQFWLSKLNEFNGNFIQAEMVKAFLDSIEYRKRFGQ